MKWVMRAWTLVIAMAGGGSAWATVVHHVIAAQGNAAPGGGTFDYYFGPPQLNSNGQVAFYAGVNGDSGFVQGIFRYDGSTGIAIALSGNAAPAGGNYDYLSDDPVQLNSSGQVVFQTELTGGSSNRGIFRHDGTTAIPIALNFTATPAGGVYDSVSYPRLADNGQVAFLANVVAGPSDKGIFRHDGTTGVAIALRSAAAPAGGNYSDLSHIFNLNTIGQVVFDADLTGGSNPEGIFRVDGETGEAIALRGAPAPAGGNYRNLFDPRLNSIGHVAHVAFLDGSSDRGLFRHGGETGSITIALGGAPAPAGGDYDTFSYPELNSTGEVAYWARLTGGLNAEGIFRHDGATATAVALQNSAAPGTTTTFFSSFDFGSSVRMNDDGIVAFHAKLIGAGVTEANNEGLWYGTNSSDLELLVREGDTMFVNGMNRTLGELPSGSDAFSLSETGIAWTATFTDNTSAIIHSTFGAVPGDYNGNGVVDAADYTVWRDSLGGATYTQSHYDLWKQNFGAVSPGIGATGSDARAAVPEPAAWMLILIGLASSLVFRRR